MIYINKMVRWFGGMSIRNAIDIIFYIKVWCLKEASLPLVGLVYVLSGTVAGKLCSLLSDNTLGMDV